MVVLFIDVESVPACLQVGIVVETLKIPFDECLLELFGQVAHDVPLVLVQIFKMLKILLEIHLTLDLLPVHLLYHLVDRIPFSRVVHKSSSQVYFDSIELL